MGTGSDGGRIDDREAPALPAPSRRFVHEHREPLGADLMRADCRSLSRSTPAGLVYT